MDGSGKILVWTNRRIADVIAGRKNIVSVGHEGVLHWKIGDSVVSGVPLKASSFASYRLVESELRKLTPIYSRHYQSLENLDLSLRILVLQILSLSEELNRLGIRVVIMPPHGSSHLLEDSILEIAARISQVPTIFTVFLPESNRAITLIQSKGIESRVPFRHNSRKELDADLTSKINEGWFVPKYVSPDLNLDIYKANSIYAKALIQQIRRHLIIQLRRDMKNDYKSNEVVFKKIQFKVDLELLAHHRNSQKYLKTCQERDKNRITKKLKEQAPVLCIYAHFQPEASTFPEGGSLNNHIDIVSYIRSLGYEAPILYREHPALNLYSRGVNSFRVGVARNTTYYHALEQLNCLFVDPKFQIDRHQNILPITMVGSVGLQRSLQGKKTIVTGFPWYGNIPGSLGIREALDDLDEAVDSLDSSAAIRFLTEHLLDSTLLAKPMARGIEVDKEEYSSWRREYENFIDSVVSNFLT